MQAIYELDEYGEATGHIIYVCDDHAWTVRRTEYPGSGYSDPQATTDALPETVCEICELLGQEA